MGSKSKSSTSTSVNTTTDTANLNLQDIDGPTVAATGDIESVVLTDQGTIQAAFDAFNQSLDDVFSFASETVAAQAAQSSEVAMLADQVTRSDDAINFQTVIKWGTVAAAVGLIAWSMRS